MNQKRLLSLLGTVIFLVNMIPAMASDETAPDIKKNGTVGERSKKEKRCELEDVAKKCCESEKGAIQCIDELVQKLQEAKKSKKKRAKDAAIDDALVILQKLKSNSEATVCAMEVIKDRNKVLKGRVQKIKKEMSVLENMFNTPVSEPFMSGPYF